MVQAAQVHEAPVTGDEILARCVHSWSVLRGTEVLVCAAIVECAPHRAKVWSVVSEAAGPHLYQISRIALQEMKKLPYTRLEATVDCEFEAGHRWMKVLGFELEAERMRLFSDDKRDHALYARIKNE